MIRPQTRYAKSGELNIANQVVGERFSDPGYVKDMIRRMSPRPSTPIGGERPRGATTLRSSRGGLRIGR